MTVLARSLSMRREIQAVRTENGTVSFGERVELARLWSANVEYSEENMRAALVVLT